jgi:hypothetical protein
MLYTAGLCGVGEIAGWAGTFIHRKFGYVSTILIGYPPLGRLWSSYNVAADDAFMMQCVYLVT